jgi:hypothetical protein
MRWPWQRHGRRRRAEAPLPPAADQWADSWAETFLPQPPPRAAVVDPPSTSTVRLGFSDGTELELDESSGDSQALRDIAATLTRRSTA